PTASAFAVDPSGGPIQFIATGHKIINDDANNQRIIDGLDTDNRLNLDFSGLYVFQGRSFTITLRTAKIGGTNNHYDITGLVWSVPLGLKSTVSGLESAISLSAHFGGDGSGLGTHLNDHWETV